MNIIKPCTVALLFICPSTYCMQQFLDGLSTGLKISGIDIKYNWPSTKSTNGNTCPTCGKQATKPTPKQSTIATTPTPPYSSSSMNDYLKKRQEAYNYPPRQPLTPAEKKAIEKRIAEEKLFNLIPNKQ